MEKLKDWNINDVRTRFSFCLSLHFLFSNIGISDHLQNPYTCRNPLSKEYSDNSTLQNIELSSFMIFLEIKMQGILATFFFQRHLCRRTTVLEVLLKIRSFTGCIPGETCTYVLGKYSNMFKKRCTVYMIHRMVVTHVSISMEDSTVGVHHRGTFQSPRHIRYVNEPDVPMTETVRGPPDHSCPSPITWGKLSPCLKYKEENCSPR